MSTKSYLVLRLDAPLMSFGGIAVDQLGVTEPAPTLSLLTGLVGNALGYEHRDAEKLGRLQERLRFGVRRDVSGRELVDFQTVDLGQEFLKEEWTTRGRVASRAGGSAKTGTHIRRRHYWADAVFTVVFGLEPEAEAPDLDAVEEALRRPERPLFLGRKPCLPSRPLVDGRIEAEGLRAALGRVALDGRVPKVEQDGESWFSAWWPRQAGEPEPELNAGHAEAVSDLRDWHNQVHTGRRFVWHGRIGREEVLHAGE